MNGREKIIETKNEPHTLTHISQQRLGDEVYGPRMKIRSFATVNN